jgi:hypothetical protein
MSRIFNGMVRSLAVRGMRDTQCGFKAFRGDVARALFSVQRIDGFGFDVEVLRIAQRRGYRIEDLGTGDLPIPPVKLGPAVPARDQHDHRSGADRLGRIAGGATMWSP